MKKPLLFIILAAIILWFGFYVYTYKQNQRKSLSFSSSTKHLLPMNLSSSFTDGNDIQKKYSCDGDGVNPPLAISGVPPGANSLVLFLEDPDAPSGTFDHWIVWNIDPDLKEIAENSFPQGAVIGLNSTGKKEYVAPCPPSGTHRYIFTLFALDTKLSISPDSIKDAVQKAMEGHVLGKGELVGKYSRK